MRNANIYNQLSIFFSNPLFNKIKMTLNADPTAQITVEYGYL